MIKCMTQIITSPYGERLYKGEKVFHKGVDLRSVDLSNRKDLPVIAPEDCIILRQDKDTYGNYFLVVKPIESQHLGYSELKFIHINKTTFNIGQPLQKGNLIGIAIIGGNSTSKHLHYETWKGKNHINPIQYFDDMGFPFEYANQSVS